MAAAAFAGLLVAAGTDPVNARTPDADPSIPGQSTAPARLADLCQVPALRPGQMASPRPLRGLPVRRALPRLALFATPATPAVIAPTAPPPRRLVKAHLARLSLLPMPMPAAKPERRTLIITVAGDLGFGGHMQPVRGGGAVRHGGTIPWPELTARIRPLIDGDLNFANLETVVTERNDLRAESKTFNFRSHPDGVRHIASLGINLLSTANNHSMDFGATGAFDTLAHLDRIRDAGKLKAHAGLGRNREEAGRPQLVDVRGGRIAFSAVGIVSGGFPLHRAGDNRPGQMAYQSPEDFADVTERLAAADAQYRILSVHHGAERQVVADATAIRKFRHEAVRERGIDLVVGHHAHVVQGIEMVDGRLIFYGLGNFLHPGMQNMATQGICRDYGLLARIHLATGDDGRFQVRAVEIVPLTDMHFKPARMLGAQAAERVNVLTYLAGGLDDPRSGARGVRFAAQTNGTGLYCAAGAGDDPGRVGELCRGWSGPDALTPAQRSRVASSCGTIGQPQLIARTPGEPRTQRVSQRNRPEQSTKSIFSFIFGN